jgi:16S rRNA A1518/A1519 N6-dimethyltransferase RsmA/KsgA/DIM1 with predicted DNA glycosylase/AP lyase activity
MDWLFWLLLGLVLIFGYVLLFGAPYLPTLKPQTQAALDLIDLKPGQTLLELGSGDGRVMMAAAERGLNVVGFEMNPLLALVSWLRTRRYGRQVKVVWGNFWTKKLPPADGVFVFLLDRYMSKLDSKITAEATKPVKLVSFAFKVPGRLITKQSNGVFLYRY